MKQEKKQVQINCLYNGSTSKIIFIQNGIDILFVVGKKTKYDYITNIEIQKNIISFNGLYFGSILNKIQIELKELPIIFENFKVRKLSNCKTYGTFYKDHSLTNLKIASKGENIYYIVINKRGDKARKFFKKLSS